MSKFIARWHDRLTKSFSDPTAKIISKINPPPVNVLEIGVANGEGATLITNAMLKRTPAPEYYGLDLFEERTPEEIRKRLPPGVWAFFYKGDSTKVLPGLDLPQMDLIIIDGGHDYKTVKADWENVQRLIHKNTTIIFDDYRREAGVTLVVDSISLSKFDCVPTKVKHVNIMKFPFVFSYVGKCVVTPR